jgi:hypothetical protein
MRKPGGPWWSGRSRPRRGGVGPPVAGDVSDLGPLVQAGPSPHRPVPPRGGAGAQRCGRTGNLRRGRAVAGLHPVGGLPAGRIDPGVRPRQRSLPPAKPPRRRPWEPRAPIPTRRGRSPRTSRAHGRARRGALLTAAARRRHHPRNRSQGGGIGGVRPHWLVIAQYSDGSCPPLAGGTPGATTGNASTPASDRPGSRR